MSRLLMGMATFVMVISASRVVSADSATTPRVTIAGGAGAVTVSLHAGALVVSQKLTPHSFDLALVRADERIRFTGDLNGQVSVTRGAASHAFSIASPAALDVIAVRQILSGSLALATFDQLMSSSWARTDKNAAVFTAAHAIVALVQGKTTPLPALVEHMHRAARPRLTTVARQVSGDCWGWYERDVSRAWYELEACLEEARSSLNPFKTLWCSYQFNLRASVAFVMLVGCTG